MAAFDTFQFDTGYEVHSTTAGSRMSIPLLSTNLPATVIAEFDIRHTDATTSVGWKAGRFWFVLFDMVFSSFMKLRDALSSVVPVDYSVNLPCAAN